MPKPEKKDVLKWYESFKEAMKAKDIDLNNPGDLMRIKVQYFDEILVDGMEGFESNRSGDYKYAFIPKNTKEQSSEYLVKEPIIDANTQDFMVKSFEAFNQFRASVFVKEKKLIELNNKNALEEDVKEAEKELEKAKEKDAEERKKYFDLCNKNFEKQTQWLFSNQKVYDEEKDYDQIEELYKMSKEGLLFYVPLDGNAQNKSQILVDKEGKAFVGYEYENNNFDFIHNPMTTPDVLFNISRTQPKEFAKWEEKYGKIDLPKFFNKKKPDDKPAPVPKPGVRSWLKWIFTFGRAKGDFERYDKYQNDLQQYETRVQQYNAEREENIKYNKSCREKMCEILNEENRKYYPESIENPAKMSSRIFLAAQNHGAMPDEDPDKGIFNNIFVVVKTHYYNQLKFEAHEHMSSFNPDYSRNKEKTEEFWKDRDIVKTPDIILAEQEEKAKLEKSYKTWQEGKEFVKNTNWIKNSFSSMVEKIGNLGGHSKETGKRMLMGCFLQNQSIEADGEPVEGTLIKSNEEIFKDVTMLLEVATNPKLMENPEYEEVVRRCEMLAEKQMDDFMVMDSIAACIMDKANSGKISDHHVPVSATAFGAMLMVNIKENPEKKSVDKTALEDYSIEDLKNLRVADDKAIEEVVNIAKVCTKFKEQYAPKVNPEDNLENELKTEESLDLNDQKTVSFVQ